MHLCRAGTRTVRRHLEGPRTRNTAACAEMKCLLFDCDGVILESEDLHRRAYNAAFEKFNVRCKGLNVDWSPEFYDVLQNTGMARLCLVLPERCKSLCVVDSWHQDCMSSDQMPSL